MRVLLAHKFYWYMGGAERYFLEVGRVLEERGHEVAYFATDDPRNPPSPWSEYFVRPPAYEGKGGAVEKRVSRWKTLTEFPRMVYSREAKAAFARLLREFKPDVVHVFAIYVHLSPSILVACREAGVPVVMSCNDYKLICTNYRLYHHGHVCEDCKGGRLWMPIVNRCCQGSLALSAASAVEAMVHHGLDIYRKNVDIFCFASEFMAHKTEEFLGADTFRWRLLRNPFNVSEYSATGEEEDYCIFLGRLVEEKGVDLLLHAMTRVPSNVKLKIVGGGPKEGELRILAARNGLKNVTFTGNLEQGEGLRAVLSGARFAIVPSLWHENFPFVIFEAYASGKAVIGSERGGIPELLGDGAYGLSYPAEDVEMLAQHIMTLWDDEALRKRMGRDARAYVEREYSDERFYELLIGVYEELTS